MSGQGRAEALASGSGQPRVVVLIGLPGCGKSTWLERNRLPSLSSDALRHLLSDDITNQAIHRQIFATLRYLLRRRLDLGRPITCMDSTNLTPYERRPYIKIAELHDAVPEAVFFDVSLEVCLERNRLRSRTVPEDAILAMARRLTPPRVDEGFRRITVVRE